MPNESVVLEIVGEGKTDLGAIDAPKRPDKGVVPILVHKLCGKPPHMLVKRRGFASLQGKGLTQKVQFVKRQAFYSRSHGAVFVIDSEGDLTGRLDEMIDGRDRELPDYPMAIGIAHPCIESWLLADAAAIRRGLDLAVTPQIPVDPERLPAPLKDRDHNPKTVLRNVSVANQKELSGREKDCIAQAMNNMGLLRERCPKGFAPFADEVEKTIQPLL